MSINPNSEVDRGDLAQFHERFRRRVPYRKDTLPFSSTIYAPRSYTPSSALKSEFGINSRRCILSLLAWLLSLLPCIVDAELIVYEGFNYPSTLTESGAEGGSGWGSPWVYSVRGYPQSTAFGGLYSGAVIGQGGNMLLKLSNQATVISRGMQGMTPHFTAGKKVWFSFFFQPGNSPASTFHIGFVPGLDAAAGIGLALTSEGGGTLRARINNTLSAAGYPLANTTWVSANRVFVLGCFERVPDGPDQLEVWLNPAEAALASGSLPAATLTVEAELTGIPTFFRTNNVGNSDGGQLGYRLSEIRLATDIASALTGTVAESDLNLVAPPPPADGVHYYVSVIDGHDGNPGTLEQPFRSIRRIASFLQAGQICIVREGVYRELLRPRNSGTAEAPVIFRAHPGEDVVITGLDAVTGWSPVAGTGAYEASVANPLEVSRMQVFFDGSIGFEARWPNRTNDNLMSPQGGRFTTGSDETKIVSTNLPNGLPADYFQDGVLWVMAGKRWSSWRSPVTSFDPATKTITFRTFAGTSSQSWVHDNHNPKSGGIGTEFYVSGAAKLLDAPNEWHYDAARSALRVVPPANFVPGTDLIELQTRQDAIDLTGLTHVRVEGFRVLAGGANLTNASHCELEKLQFSYPSFNRMDFGIHVIPGRMGVFVSGSNNTVRECEVGWSWGNGITLAGNDNRAINNYVHNSNLLGTYAVGVETRAGTARNLVAWNTVTKTGRDGVRPNGLDHQFLHNRISHIGQICDDTGAFYISGEGCNVEVGYNWIHDGGTSGMRSGIYLDNFTTGFILHHNIIWNIPFNAIHLNRPSCFHVVLHNTLFGKINNYTGPWTGVRNTATGTQVGNNLLSGVMEIDYGAPKTANITNATALGFDPSTEEFLTVREGQGEGRFAEGVSLTDGSAPDIGAIQTGVDYPRPGHNFAIRREIEWNRPALPMSQLLRNNIFLEDLANWTVVAGTAAIVSDSGFNYPGPESRNTIHAKAVSLTGDGRVEQNVTGLVPGNIYSLFAYRKQSADTVSAGVGIVFPDGTEYRFVFNSSSINWQLSENFEFVVPAGQTSGRVFLWMGGTGTAYFDNIGFMQKWHNNSLHFDPTRFNTHPAGRTSAVGGSAVFTAKSELNSTRTNRWELRVAGSGSWVPLSTVTGITVDTSTNDPKVTVNPVKPDQQGDEFRCVASYRNFQAFSRPGKLSVTGVTLDKNDHRVGVGERQYQVTVNVPAGTLWSVTNLLPWVTVSPSSGTGPGTVMITVAANSTGADREGVIRIAGRDHLVRQIDGELFGEWMESLDAPMRTVSAAPAGDGVANLLKYAFGLTNPLAQAHARQPSIGVDDRIGFQFFRAPHRKDVTYIVRATDRLGPRVSEWPIVARAAAGGETISLVTGLDVVETTLGNDLVKVELAFPPVESSRRFYTLEVLLTEEGQ